MSYITICKNKTTDYKIVFSPKSEDSGAAAALLQSVVYSCTGVSIPLISDEGSVPTAKEIIVGKTNRENVTFPYERYSIGDIGFICGVYGEALALVGGSFHCERFAVMKFLSDFFGFDIFNPYNKPKMLDTLCVPSDYYYENSPRSWVENIPNPTESDGALIYMIPTYSLPGGNNALRGMGYILRSRTGKLLVIDGGHASNAELIIAMLQKLSGEDVPTVDGWFFTHVHADHVDAFLNIAQSKPDSVKVKMAYHHFPTREFATHWREEARYDKLQSVMNTFCPFCEIKRGDTANFDDIHMQVIFNVDDHFEKYLTDRIENSRTSINAPHGDAINNSDTLYKFTADGHSLLILGDFMHFGEEYVYKYYPETIPSFKADMVQCAHHGSNFMGQRIYSYIGARVALWSTTLDAWFWKDNSTAWLRARLFEIGIVKNHIAGEGIIPIPFDMSHISTEESAHLQNALSRITFTKGEMPRLLLVNKTEYELYTDGEVEFTLDTYAENSDVRVMLSNAEIKPADGIYSFPIAQSKSFTVTVNDKVTYRFNTTARPAHRELLKLDMSAARADGAVPDVSEGRALATNTGAAIVNESGRFGVRPNTNGYLSVKNDAFLLMGDNDFTISVWIKSDTAEATQTVYYFGDDTSGSTRYMLRIANAKHVWSEHPNRLIFSLTSGKSSTGANVISAEPITANEWHLVTVTSTGLTQRMYIDGKFSSERSFMRPIDLDTENNELLVGVQPHGANAFEGAIGELTILNYALNDDEIAELYKKEKN